MVKALQWLGLLFIPILWYSWYHLGRFIGTKFQVIVGISILIAWGITQIKTDKRFSFSLLALSGAFFTYWVMPGVFVDDTGFVMRYLKQAAEGCFYCFNPSEGPVYGISGFLYGMTTSLIALPGLISPEWIIKGVSFAGLCWLYYMLLRIFDLVSDRLFIAVLSAIGIVLFSAKFLMSTTIGLETNFHLAILFTAIFYFFKKEAKMMWLFTALAVISKLDAVPVACTIGALHLLENWKSYLQKNSWSLWKDLLLYAGVPLFIFITLSFILFDGPLPQSAYAKVNFHINKNEHWFPFLEYMLMKAEIRVLFKIFVGLFICQLLVELFYKRFQWSHYFFGIAFIGVMTLYYFYNPKERMVWYYALPELLLAGQILVSSISILKNARFRDIAHAAFFISIAISGLTNSIHILNWVDKHLKTVELERLRIGEDLKEKISESDTLMSGHGLFGAKVKGYVLDWTGLNCKLATDHELKTEEIISTYQPQWYINHSPGYILGMVGQNGYTIESAYFNINRYGYKTWLVFQKSDQARSFRRLPSDTLQGNQIVLPLTHDLRDISICTFGVENLGDQTTQVSITAGNTTQTVAVPPAAELHLSEQIQSVLIRLEAPTDSILIQGDSIKVYDPIGEIVVGS